MNLPFLYNLDIARTATYTETRTVGEDGRLYLTHIPKKDTLSIDGFIYNSSNTPANNQFFIEWGEEFGYVFSNGLLILNASNAGVQLVITYVPIASRVDANVINQLINLANTLDGNVYSKDQMSTPGGAHVAYENLDRAPGLATESAQGLLSAEDKRKLQRIELGTNPLGMLYADDTPLIPTTYGGGVKLKSTSTVDIVPHIDTNEIEIVVNQSGLALPTAAQTAAMSGTAGSPSSFNRFVTDADTRMTDSRIPLAHMHSIMNISGLDDLLLLKADTVHSHNADQIIGLQIIQGPKGDQGIQGVQGIQGIMGPVGPVGPIGLTGAQGIQGQQGIAGIQGIQGIQGPMGLRGEQGIPGPQGSQGIQGIQGIKGDPGDTTGLAYAKDIIVDHVVNGFTLLVPTGNTFVGISDGGSAYVNGNRPTIIPGDPKLTFNYIAPLPPVRNGATPANLDPEVTGEYTLATPGNYVVNVVAGNPTPGNLAGMQIVWNKDGGVFSLPTAAVAAGNTLSHGIGIVLKSGNAESYSVGYGWTITLSGIADVYDDLYDNGTIKHKAVIKDSPAPTKSASALRLRKVSTNGTKISAVTNLALAQPTLKSSALDLGGMFRMEYNASANSIDFVYEG